MFEESDEANRHRLADELIELAHMEMEINREFRSVADLNVNRLGDLKQRVREWLEQALRVAHAFGPREFAIGMEVGWPPKISVSFTWPGPSEKGQPEVSERSTLQ